MAKRVTALFAIGLAACSAAARTGTTSRFRPGRYVVRFTHAALPTRRPDNSPWHVTPPDHRTIVIGGLVGLAIGNPELGMTVGKTFADPGGEALAPAPYVVMKLAGNTYRIAATRRSYSPTWEQPIVIDARALHSDEQVIIQVMDAVDESLIGQRETTAGEFFGAPSRIFANLGCVASLDVSVEPAAPRTPAQYELRLPAEATLDALLRGYADQWQPISVLNGDTVTIDAVGKVCPFGEENGCYGPDGVDAGDHRGRVREGFETAPFASLVGVFPDGRFVVGSKLERPVSSSGRVLLFVNDARPQREYGGLLIHVVVTPAK